MNNRAFIVALVALALSIAPAFADNSSVPQKVWTFIVSTVIDPTQVNKNFDDLFTGLAQIGQANIITNGVSTDELAAGCVTDAKLASAVTAKLVPTGTMLDYIGTVAPTGYALADGKTIGDSSSGATVTGGGGSQYSDLYALLWNGMADAQAPVSSGRGGSAAADFAAHKTIALPDLRGRVIATKDDLGGSVAGRLSSWSGGAGFTPTTLGNYGGTESVTITSAQMPSHTHTQNSHNHTQNSHNHTQDSHNHTQNSHATHSYFAAGTSVGVMNDESDVLVASAGATAAVGSATATNIAATATNNVETATNIAATAVNQSTGSSAGHSSVQPTYILGKIIKLIVPLEVGP